jgi:hypothetical protein
VPQFGEKELVAFESIKTMCHQDQLLAFADYSKPFYILTCTFYGMKQSNFLVSPLYFTKLIAVIQANS